MPLIPVADLMRRQGSQAVWSVAYDPEASEFVLIHREPPVASWQHATVHPLRAYRNRLIYKEARLIVDAVLTRGLSRPPAAVSAMPSPT